MVPILRHVISAFVLSDEDIHTEFMADNMNASTSSFPSQEESIPLSLSDHLDSMKRIASTFFWSSRQDDGIFCSVQDDDIAALLSTETLAVILLAGVILAILALINYIQHSPRFHWISTKDAKQMKSFCWYIALDGHYMVSFSGGAGIMKIEFPSCKVTARYYPGISYGHAVEVSPDGRFLFLGNYSQQIAIVEASSMELVSRLPMTDIEDFDAPTFRLQAPVFAEWLSNSEFLVALPKNVWKISMKVTKAAKSTQGIVQAQKARMEDKDITTKSTTVVTLSYTRVCKHNCDALHQMIWAAKTSTLLLADTGSEESRPRRVELIQIPNLMTGANTSTALGSRVTNKVLHLQDDVWHLALDPESGTKVYGATYSKFECVPYQIRDRSRYFGVGFERNYVYEICTEKQTLSRIFSGSVAVPLHLNSDHVVANNKLLIASGSAHDGFELDLNDFSTWRTFPGGPSWLARWVNLATWINALQNVWDAVTHLPVQMQALVILFRTNGGRFMNGIYAMDASPCQRYICLGHRDCNYVRVIDSQSHRTITKFFLPTTPCPGNDHPSWLQGQFVTRHGLHHSCTSEPYRPPSPVVAAPGA